MRKVVFTIKDDVCLKNGKDAAKQAELLTVLTHYGTVEDFDRVMASVQAEWQRALNEMTAQYNAIADQKLTPDELSMVKAYRENKTAVVGEYIAEADSYKNQLEAIKNEHEARVAKLKALLED